MEEKTTKIKRFRDDDDGDSVPESSDSPEVKRIRDDLLGFFDDSDSHPTSQDLDSVMESFQEELSAASSVVVVDLTSESGESQPELGYLLEASDDELGLPPSSSVKSPGGEAKNDVSELIRVDSGDSTVNGANLWGFDEQISSYDDSFGLGTVENNFNPGSIAFDEGLFEYSDPCFDYSDYSWRPGTMPAE